MKAALQTIDGAPGEQTHPVPPAAVFQEVPPSLGQTVYAARRALYESANRLLLWICGALILTLFAVLAWTHGVYRESLQRQPLIVGIDQKTGAVTALRPEGLQISVNETILRSVLENFVRQHFERLPILSRRDYNRSLFMMASTLTGPQSSVKADMKEIEALETPGHGQEVEVQVQNSTFSGTQSGCHPDGEAPRPCLAQVYFTKAYFNPTDHTVQYTKSSIASITFYLRRKVENAEIQINPIGLLVTDLHESEGH